MIELVIWLLHSQHSFLHQEMGQVKVNCTTENRLRWTNRGTMKYIRNSQILPLGVLQPQKIELSCGGIIE